MSLEFDLVRCVRVLLLGSLVLTGCNRGTLDTLEKEKDVPVEVTKPAEPDSSDSLEALDNLSAKLKRDDEGFVVEVDFRGTEIDNEGLDTLAGLKRVRSVLLGETAVTDAGLATLGKVKTLQNVDVRNCMISNEGLTHLSGLTNLRALRLSGENGQTSVDDEGMVAVKDLTNLKVITLDFLWIGEEGITQLAGLKNLEELYLAKTLADDATLAKLDQFPKLKKLRISQTQVSAEGMTHLAKRSQLEELDLSECSLLLDDAMAPLADMTQLVKLNLWRVAITDVGIMHLSNLTHLRWLNVDNTQLTDKGLIALKGMDQLEFLHLGSTTVSDVGLTHLEHLKSLKDLKVTRTAVTAAGVETLKMSLPDTEIQLEYLGKG